MTTQERYDLLERLYLRNLPSSGDLLTSLPRLVAEAKQLLDERTAVTSDASFASVRDRHDALMARIDHLVQVRYTLLWAAEQEPRRWPWTIQSLLSKHGVGPVHFADEYLEGIETAILAAFPGAVFDKLSAD